MYFVTDEPLIFNTNTGVVIQCRADLLNKWSVDILSFGKIQSVFCGSRQECEDFIYSIAGWVGAVNPVTLEKANGE